VCALEVRRYRSMDGMDGMDDRLSTNAVAGFNENIYMALVAEQAERYDEMVEHARLVVLENKSELSIGARALTLLPHPRDSYTLYIVPYMALAGGHWGLA
jgi:hypothetical protein